jgi:hypothetical protein
VPYRTPCPPEPKPPAEDKVLYDRGVAAIEHFNRSCPKGFVIEPLFMYLDGHRMADYKAGMVTKHKVHFYFNGNGSWSEFCCEQEWTDLNACVGIKGWWWRRKWKKAFKKLDQRMIDKEKHESDAEQPKKVAKVIQISQS